MQLMPGTARQIAGTSSLPSDESSLADPSFNIEFGQTYLEELRDSPWTGGLLPKVIAAYNAGPGSVKKWNEELRDGNDPLLRSEEHTSELQSLMRISYAVFCLKKKHITK